MNDIKLEVLSDKRVPNRYIRYHHPFVHIFKEVRDSRGYIYSQCLNIDHMIFPDIFIILNKFVAL